MGVVFTNNAETTLAAAITSTSATSISVTSSSTFPTVGAGEYFYATITDGTNLEIVKITAVSGTTWTVVRASDNTTARTFANGSTVQLRTTAALLTDIQENIASKSANQTVYNATAASSATAYDVGINPGVEANAMVFLDGVMQHHDTFSFSGSTLTFDAAPTNGTKIEVIVDNLINLQSSNLTVDTFTATSNQTAFTLSDSPAAEANLIVFINGVFQNQAAYTISNNTLTLDTGVVTGRTVTVYVINPVNIGTPSDGTVTSAKLSGNITTPGTLTVGSHDVAFDSPTFVVDNSNSRVGLGTASPSVPVDIVGEGKISSHFTILDAGSLKVGTGADMVLSSDGTHGTIAAANGDLTLDVAGDITLDAAGQQIIFASAGTNVGQIDMAGTDLEIKSLVNNADLFIRGTDGGSEITAVTFDMSDAGAATFNSNIGIGVVPTKELHLYKTNGDPTILFENSKTATDSGDFLGALEFKGNDASTGASGVRAAIATGIQNTSGGAFLQFKTANSGSSVAEAMRIQADGKVGVACLDPTAYLEIDPAAADTAIFSIRRQDHATIPLFKIVQDSSVSQGAGHCHITSSNRDMSITAGENLDKTKGLYIKTTGEVGIGSTSPSTLLHINGSGDAIRVESTNAGAGGAQMDLLHYTASPADNDTHAMINMGGYYSGSSSAYGSSIKSIWTDVSAREAALTFTTRNAGDFNENMRIHTSGAVTKPRNCYFLAVRTSNLNTYDFTATSGATTTIFTDLVSAQTSALGTSSFSTTDGTFSAPVDGLYLFHFSFYSNVTIEQAWLTSNGARINYTDVTANTSATTAGTVFNGSIQYYMTSGASIRIHPYSAGSSSDSIYDNVYHTYWKGVLLG